MGPAPWEDDEDERPEPGTRPEPAGATPRAPPAGRRRRSFWGFIAYWSAVGLIWVGIGLLGFIAVFGRGLPDVSAVNQIHRQPSITYLDASGQVIAVRGSPYGPPVDLDALPAYVPAAFIAIEDKQFYRHFGFNPWGMARGLIYNLTHHGGALQGGSTITQQLARNLFLTRDQTLKRKAQELILAVRLEQSLSKKQILSLYLNRVSYGAGAYGIEAASQRYFDKPATQLTLGEAALLAGAMKGPSRYNPSSNGERAAKRATLVLYEMERIGAITRAQRLAAFSRQVRVAAHPGDQKAPYFIDWLDDQVRARIGEPTEDIIVDTTLDLTLQADAERAVGTGVRGHAAEEVRQAALVAMDGVGRVRAYVGGAGYAESPFDRIANAHRQAGSAFKPFVYLTAMEAGHQPDEPVVDEPVTVRGWTPRNYTGRYLGPITLRTALAQSINTVAARLAESVGQARVAETAHRLGVTSPIQTDPSMALGAVEVTPLEMARAYAGFSNGGIRVDPFGISRIRTAAGRVLYGHDSPPPPLTPVIQEPALSEMTEMMRGVVTGGTGGRARIGGWDIAGKTGTTSDYRDAWFIGFTGGFVTAVWAGKDDNTPMRKVTGGGAPAEIWRDFMVAALPRLSPPAIPGAQPASTPPEPEAAASVEDPELSVEEPAAAPRA